MKKTFLLITLITLIFSISLSAEDDRSFSQFKTGIFAQNFILAGELMLTYENIYRTGAVVHITPQIALRPGIIFSINSEKEQDVYGSGPEYTSEESMFLGGSIDAFYIYTSQ